MARVLAELGVGTVCRASLCPNRSRCWGRGTATFLLLGDRCTRRCPFCAVPAGPPAPPDPEEPGRVAEAAARLGLRHVVLTCVTRDDLPDGGASHLAAAVAAVRARLREAAVEVLAPDFGGDPRGVAAVLAAGVHVFAHNVETVPRLYPRVRPGASYGRSLAVLAAARAGTAVVKSGLMLGLGEEEGEVAAVLRDLRAAGCQVVTLGQYLRPSAAHLPVSEYVPPARFAAYRRLALGLGFRAALAGPLVRSSYRAGEVYRAVTGGVGRP